MSRVRALSLATQKIPGDQFLRQALEAQRMMKEYLELMEQEIACWRMFGIRAEWCMDSLYVEAP